VEVTTMRSADVTPHRGARFIAAAAVIAFVLNWVWEMAQMSAYGEMAGVPWSQTLLPCTVAAVGDVAITMAVYGVGALAAGAWRWGMSGRWNVYATGALLGAACAVGYDYRALAVGRWSYTERMPIVPLLGVGLWPCLQLTLLVPIVFAAARWTAQRP
jgi:hypothetical protein